MEIKCPVKLTVWGTLNSQADLVNAIIKSGQPFGVDESGPACKVVSTAPCDKTYYQWLGLGLHKGVDIPVPTGTQVFAAHSGKVSRISDNITQGIGVVIYDPIQNIESVYWHLKSHNVQISDKIEVGQLIALSDNTGYSEGPHLHFQINLTDVHGKSLNAVDPMPYFVWDTMTVEEVTKQYVLAFYREPTSEELNFWSGKSLLDFLNTAIKDRATFLTAHE